MDTNYIALKILQRLLRGRAAIAPRRQQMLDGILNLF
jgi:hypothetical protein